MSDAKESDHAVAVDDASGITADGEEKRREAEASSTTPRDPPPMLSSKSFHRFHDRCGTYLNLLADQNEEHDRDPDLRPTSFHVNNVEEKLREVTQGKQEISFRATLKKSPYDVGKVVTVTIRDRRVLCQKPKIKLYISQIARCHTQLAPGAEAGGEHIAFVTVFPGFKVKKKEFLFGFLTHDDCEKFAYVLRPAWIPQKLDILVNPFSGRKQGRAIAEKISRVFEAANVQVNITETQYKDYGIDYARNLDIESVDGVICVSGDSTLTEVVNGFSQREDAEIALQTPIGLIGAGSSNAIVKHFRSMNPIEAALRIVRGHFVPIDAIKLSYGDLSQINLCDIGFGAIGDINHYSENSKWIRKFGPIRYGKGFCHALCCLPSYSCEVSVVPADENYTTPHSIRCGIGCPVCKTEKEALHTRIQESVNTRLREISMSKRRIDVDDDEELNDLVGRREEETSSRRTEQATSQGSEAAAAMYDRALALFREHFGDEAGLKKMMEQAKDRRRQEHDDTAADDDDDHDDDAAAADEQKKKEEQKQQNGDDHEDDEDDEDDDGGHSEVLSDGDGAEFAASDVVRREDSPKVQEALSLLTKASNQDHYKATVKLAYCYEHGIGGPNNVKKAMELYDKAVRLAEGLSGGMVSPRLASAKGALSRLSLVDLTEDKEWQSLEGPFDMVFALNMSTPFAPAAHLSDGALDVCLMPKQGCCLLCGTFASLGCRSNFDTKYIKNIRVKKLRLTALEPTSSHLNFDGEVYEIQPGETLTIEVLRSHFTYLGGW